ncbi:NlpC/P60 family protein [Streptomyces sp. NPDC055078]
MVGAGAARDGTAAPVAGRPPGAAPPAVAVADALTRLRVLYRQAEDARADHRASEDRLRKQRARTAGLGQRLGRARSALLDSRAAAGRLAREQYQGRSELSPHLRLLLARDPRHALDEGHVMERAAAYRVSTVTRLAKDAKRTAALASASRKALARERVLAQRQQRAKETAENRLRAVEQLLASLTDEQIAALADPAAPAASADRDDPAGRDGRDDRDEASTPGTPGGQPSTPGAPGDAAPGTPGGQPGPTGPRTPTASGGEALRYAVGQIGKPYVWGAAGPQAYDCSGLTSRAWAAAGVEIPRTSQEQWARLTRVPLRSLRPGDLVVYFPGATHVAIYLGGGMVVQAPRPGAKVKVSPLAANPPLGAVRPDPAGSPLAEYTPPRLPEGATAGPDTGYSGAGAPEAAATSPR